MEVLDVQVEQHLSGRRLERVRHVLDDHLLVLAADAQARERLVDLGQLEAQRVEAAADALQRQPRLEQLARHLDRDQVAEAVERPPADAHRRPDEPGLRPVAQAALRQPEQARHVARRVGGLRRLVGAGLDVDLSSRLVHRVPALRAGSSDTMASPSMKTCVPSLRT
jgi:hypothetical protein